MDRNLNNTTGVITGASCRTGLATALAATCMAALVRNGLARQR